MLYNVRYEVAVSEMMENNMDSMELFIRSEMAREDKDDTGWITIQQCEVAMNRCKKLNLTPFQIHILLGLSDCDGDGQVPYTQFAKVAKQYINDSFQFDQMCMKQKILEKKMKQPDFSTKHTASQNLDKVELFRTFKKYDRNMNGTLDFSEYTQCLTECPEINLTKHEIVTLAMSADFNGDGEIDFAEFIKHFADILDNIQFQKSLDNEYKAIIDDEQKKAFYMTESIDDAGMKAKKELDKLNKV